MRVLVLLLIGLLAAGSAAADRDRDRERGGYHGKLGYSEVAGNWRKTARSYSSSRLNFLRTSNLNSGVCDELQGSSRGLRMMCIAFCELQSCSPDFSAENPFESCSRSSKWIYNRYEQRRGAGDPEMPCVQQPEAVAECPCWTREELANLRGQGADDRFANCALDVDFATSNILNFDNWRIISQTPGAYSVSLSSFGGYGADNAPTCAVNDTCADGNCLGESRMMSITPEQFAACEADVAMSAANRGLVCN